MLEGIRGEESIAELCRREQINQNVYYRWSKEFLEAGKKRLAGDTKREATSDEVQELRTYLPLGGGPQGFLRENVADPLLLGHSRLPGRPVHILRLFRIPIGHEAGGGVAHRVANRLSRRVHRFHISHCEKILGSRNRRTQCQPDRLAFHGNGCHRMGCLVANDGKGVDCRD